MSVSKPLLPPCKGYVEVEINGEHFYKNVETGELLIDETIFPDPIQTDIDLMADAYREGVNEAE